MKKRISSSKLVLLFLTLSLIFAVSCRKNGDVWKGTIRTENGITVVRNPKTPLYKNAAISLDEELSIGQKDGPEENQFARIASVDADSEGNIYVLNLKPVEIKVFDRNGGFLRKVGAVGQGPGEFSHPQFLQIVNGKGLIVFDVGTHNFLTFAVDGAFLGMAQDKKQSDGLWPIIIDKKGFVIGTRLPPPPLGGPKLVRMEPNHESEDVIVQQNLDWFLLKKVELPLSMICADAALNGKIIWGIPDEYILHMLNSDGKPEMTISCKAGAIKVTEDGKKELKEQEKSWIKSGFKTFIPKNYPFYNAISIDAEGRIFVATYEKTKNGQETLYDIFDPDGRYIAKIPMPSRIEKLLWKKGKLYTVEKDEEDYPVLKRYAVRWNFQ
jgi:hypothetical protein